MLITVEMLKGGGSPDSGKQVEYDRIPTTRSLPSECGEINNLRTLTVDTMTRKIYVREGIGFRGIQPQLHVDFLCQN